MLFKTDIEVADTVKGQLATELQQMCPMKVFDIEDIGSNQTTAVAARPRDCTMCRECIRQDGWSDRVKLRRKADFFLFSVESVGSIPPEEIVREAISILKDKSIKFLKEIDDYESSL